MPPGDSGRGGFLRGYNSMQMQMGLSPQGFAPQPLQMLPMPPPPSAVSQQLLQQQMQVSQMTTPAAPMQFGMTPMARPQHLRPWEMMEPQFSNPMFGTRRAMARQSAIQEQNQLLGNIQAGSGVAGRGMMGMGAAAIGGAMAGPLGALAAPALLEYSGAGQAMQMGINNAFQPVIQQRARGLQFQNMSQNFVRSGLNMSSSGQGLTMQAAQRTVNQLQGMAQSEEFQDATKNMFNTQDVMKISRLAGNLGMLNQSSTTDQITRDIKKISVSLSNFMKLAGEPDIQQAMQQMATMRNMGMTFPEISVATSNARQFARMAGTDTRTMMQQGMQGAQMFQAAGLSGAVGMQASMGAQGMAGLAVGTMTPRQLAMAGGQQGIARTLQGAAARTATMDVLLPALLERRNGQLGISQDALRGVLTGDQNIQQLIQQGAGNMRQLGGRAAIQELSTRRRELQDEMMSRMSPEMQNMLPMLIAARTARSVPGMTFGASLRTMGFGEQEARSMELMAQSPEFRRAMIQQRQATLLEAREERAALRERTRERAHTPEFVRSMQRQLRIGRRVQGLSDTVSEFLGNDQDMEEELEARGGRVQRVFERDRFRTDLGDARRRDLARRDPTRFLAGSAGQDRMIQQGIAAEERLQTATGLLRRWGGVTGNILSRGIGPGGVGFTDAGRGGEFLADTTRRQEDLVTRALMETGVIVQDPREVRERARELDNLGRMASQANNANARTRAETRQRSIEAIQRRAGPNAEVDPQRRRRATAIASTAIRSYLDSKSVLGFQVGGGARTAEMQNAMREALIDQGYTAEEAATYVNQDTMQDAMNLARPSMSADEQSMLDNMVQGGSEARAGLEGQSVAQMRAGRIRRTEAFMESIGAGRGFLGLGGISETDQRTVLDLLGGGDDQSRLNAIRLLELSEDDEAQTRAAEMRQEMEERLGPERMQELEDRSAAQLAGLDEDVARTVGSGLAGKDIEDVLRRGAATQEDRAISEGSEGLQALLGGNAEVRGRVQEALDEGDTDRARQIIQSFAESDRSIGREQRDRLMRIVEGDDFTGDLSRAVENEISRTGGRVSGGEGLDTALELAQQGDFLAAIEEIGRVAMPGGGGDVPSGEEGVETPRNFEEAVVMFSEAARDLKEAAEQFNGDRSIGSLAQAAASASPLGFLGNLFGGGGD